MDFLYILSKGSADDHDMKVQKRQEDTAVNKTAKVLEDLGGWLLLLASQGLSSKLLMYFQSMPPNSLGTYLVS